MSRRNLSILAMLLMVIGTSGCGSIFEEEFQEPEHDLRDHALLIPPFREGKLWHYESSIGERLARMVSALVQEQCDAQLVDDEYVADQVFTEFEDPPPWDRWGRRTGATHVVLGSIREVSFGAYKIVGMTQGRLEFEIEVWDVEKNEPVYNSPPIKVVFPDDPSKETAGILDQSRKELAEQLFRKASKRISAMLCGKKSSIMNE